MENATKFSRLESISSIEDNYLEAVTGHRLFSIKKATLKKLAVFTGKQLCWSLFLIKFFRPATLLKRDSNTGVFLCILQIFISKLMSESISNLYL